MHSQRTAIVAHEGHRGNIGEMVANTVSAPHEIEEELNHLQRVLMDKGNDLGANEKPSPPLP